MPHSSKVNEIVGALLIIFAAVPTSAQQSKAEPAPDAGSAVTTKQDKKSGQSNANDESESASDLESILQQSSTEPVSRVLGYRIQEHRVKPYVHGTLVGEWNWIERRKNTFRLREAHVYVGADIYDVLRPEVFAQFEQSPPNTTPVSLRYAQIDAQILKDLLVARVGLFLIPFGIYNTTLFNRYASKFGDRPLIHGQIVPAAWSEIGLEVHGRWEWAENLGIAYAVYVSNGLQPDPNRPGARDAVWTDTNNRKTVGARLGVDPILGLSMGFSAYQGQTDLVPHTDLKLLGLDILYRRGAFSLEGEGMLGAQQVPDSGDVPKRGFYAAAGYKIVPAFEPVLGIEGSFTAQNAERHSTRALVGFNYFPLPEKFPTAVVKGSYGYSWTGTGIGTNRVAVQLVVGY